MLSTMSSLLNKSSGKNIVWECLKFEMPIFSTSLFDTTASLETHNQLDVLSSLSDPESLIQDIIGPPTAASSPIVQGPNCQSIKNKKAELHTIMDSEKPDIILGNES